MKKSLLLLAMLLLASNGLFAQYDNPVSSFAKDLETFAIISALINFIVLIAFFVMGANVGAIKRLLQSSLTKSSGTTYIECYNKGELNEFKDKKSEALDNYMDALFHIY